MPVGAMFGALISGPYSTKYGRRKTLMIANLITIFSCALYLPPYIPVFLIARFVSGLSVGIYGVLCPVIIFETIPLELSGKIGGLIQLNINLGIAVAYALSLSLPTGDYSSDKRSYLYILVYCFQGVFAIFQLVLFLMKYKLETPG